MPQEFAYGLTTRTRVAPTISPTVNMPNGMLKMKSLERL
jgi:hypothetical protein